MATTIGNIDLSRGQAPYNPMAGEYAIPANRTFTWESSPQEQSMLAAGMGRPDLSALMATGQYGPLAGQQYQYNNGRTTIGYGGSPWFSQGGFPGGGFPGGGYGPGGSYNPGGGNPWGDWTPPDWTPPDWTPPDWTPPDWTPPDWNSPGGTMNPPFNPFEVDPTKVTYPPGSLVGQPDIFDDFSKFSLNENKRIQEQKAWEEKLRNPISDINLNFGFEDTKANAARGIFPEKTYQDILNEKQAFMDAGGATASTNFTRGNDISNIGQPGIAAQQAEAARIAAMRAIARENALGGGRPVAPKSLAEELADANRSTSRLFGMDQAAQAQDRLALEALSRQRAAQQQAVLDPSGGSLQRNQALAATAQERMMQQQAAGAAQRIAERDRAIAAQRARENAMGGGRPVASLESLEPSRATSRLFGMDQAVRDQGRSAREALEAGTRPRVPDPVLQRNPALLRTPAGSPMGFSPSGIPSGSPNEAYARQQAAITQAREMQNLANQRRMEEARQRVVEEENNLRLLLGFGAPRPRASNQSISPFGGEPPRPVSPVVSRPTSQPGPGGPAKPKPEQDDSSNARQAAEADAIAAAKRAASRAASVGQSQVASKGKSQAAAKKVATEKAKKESDKKKEDAREANKKRSEAVNRANSEAAQKKAKQLKDDRDFRKKQQKSKPKSHAFF